MAFVRMKTFLQIRRANEKHSFIIYMKDDCMFEGLSHDILISNVVLSYQIPLYCISYHCIVSNIIVLCCNVIIVPLVFL